MNNVDIDINDFILVYMLRQISSSNAFQERSEANPNAIYCGK